MITVEQPSARHNSDRDQAARNKNIKDERLKLTSSHDEVRLFKVETTLKKLLSKKKTCGGCRDCCWIVVGREEENSKEKGRKKTGGDLWGWVFIPER